MTFMDFGLDKEDAPRVLSVGEHEVIVKNIEIKENEKVGEFMRVTMQEPVSGLFVSDAFFAHTPGAAQASKRRLTQLVLACGQTLAIKEYNLLIGHRVRVTLEPNKRERPGFDAEPDVKMYMPSQANGSPPESKPAAPAGAKPKLAWAPKKAAATE